MEEVVDINPILNLIYDHAHSKADHTGRLEATNANRGLERVQIASGTDRLLW